MTKTAILATCFCVALVAACGGSTDDDVSSAGTGGSGAGANGSGGTPAPDLPDEAPPDFDAIDEIPEAEAGAALGELCPVFFACDCPGAEGVTTEACEAHFASLADQAVSEGVDVTYDGDCVARVIAAFEYLGCVTQSQAMADWDVLLGAAQLDSCKMYYGTKGAGEACTTLSDSNGDDCQQPLECVDGTCAVRPGRIAEGDACVVQEDCQAGLVCIPSTLGGMDSTCTVLPAAGEPCVLGVLCEPGAICVERACEPLPGPGAACAIEPDVFERQCSPDGRCVDGTCEALPLGGQACAANICAPGFQCASGTCKAEAAAVCAGGPFPLFPG
jgi:hypothetical protein